MKSISRLDLFGILFSFTIIAILYRPLWFQGRVLASLDSEAYFYPNASYLAASLRAGRVPLWNPLIFAGVPFLANSQVGALYPPSWLYLLGPVSSIANVLLLGHIALFSVGMYLLARISLKVGVFGATFAAASASGAGLVGGMVGHLNQVEALAWAPFSILLVERSVVRPSFRLAALASLTLALGILAGHTQVVYLTAALAFACGIGRMIQIWYSGRNLRALARPMASLICAPSLAILLAGMQVIPTLELTRLSIRSSGLGFADAAAASLPPPDLLISLLPTIGQSPPSTEWIAYVAICGYLLALYGLLRSGRIESKWLGLIAVVGLVLALGQFTPIYGIAYAVVPGFRLFRVPARWITVWVIGVSLLAGIGADRLATGRLVKSAHPGEWTASSVRSGRVQSTAWGWYVAGGALILSMALLAYRYRRLIAWPSRDTLLLWAGACLVFFVVTRLPSRLRLVREAGVLALLVVELTTAASILPINDAVWSDAIESPRATVTDVLSTASTDRILALGDNTYDPGDLGAIRTRLDETLPPSARDAYVTAVKHVEGMTPNTLMRFGLPTIDGYDGGILPLARYHDFKQLFANQGPDVADGRLRIQLRSAPAPSLLAWLNVRWLLMDRLRDRWVDGTYYDLGIAQPLVDDLSLNLRADRGFTASHFGVFLRGATTLPPSGVFTLRIGDTTGTLVTDAQSGTAIAIDSAVDPNGLWFWVVPLPIKVRADGVTVSWQGEPGTYLRGLSAVDDTSGLGQSVTVSPAMRLSFLGDMKTYEDLAVLPRAFLADGLTVTPTTADAMQRLRDVGFDAKREAVAVAGEVDPTLVFRSPSRDDPATIVLNEPEHIVVRATASDQRVLVLTDSYYPGWRATIDGHATPILPVNLMFRGVIVPPGTHLVDYTYQPGSLYAGVAVSAVGLVAFVLLLTRSRRRDPDADSARPA